MGTSDARHALPNREIGPKTGPKVRRRSPDAARPEAREPRGCRGSRSGARGTRTPDLLGAIQAAKSVEFSYLAGILGPTRAVHAADKCAQFAGDRWSSITRDARSDETRRVASAAQREPGGPVWQDPQLPRLPLVLREQEARRSRSCCWRNAGPSWGQSRARVAGRCVACGVERCRDRSRAVMAGVVPCV
jgi:hypothetical protein